MGRMKAAAIRAEQAPGSDLFGWVGDPVEAMAPPAPAGRAPEAQAVEPVAALPAAAPAAPAAPSPRATAATPARPAARATLPSQVPVAMAAERSLSKTTLYIVMPYADRSNGAGAPKWRPGTASSHMDPNRALKAAENCIGKGGTVGAIVARQTAEPDLGEWSEPEIIGRFGRTPEPED